VQPPSVQTRHTLAPQDDLACVDRQCNPAMLQRATLLLLLLSQVHARAGASLTRAVASTCPEDRSLDPRPEVERVELPLLPWNQIFVQWEYATADSRAYVRSLDTVDMPRRHVVDVRVMDYRCGIPASRPVRHTHVIAQQTNRRQSLRPLAEPAVGDPHQTTPMSLNDAAKKVALSARSLAVRQANELCPHDDHSCIYSVVETNREAAGDMAPSTVVKLLDVGPAELLMHAQPLAQPGATRPVLVHCGNFSRVGATLRVAALPWAQWEARNSTHATTTRGYDQTKDDYATQLTVRIYPTDNTAAAREVATDDSYRRSLAREIEAAAYEHGAVHGSTSGVGMGFEVHRYPDFCLAQPAAIAQRIKHAFPHTYRMETSLPVTP
jgi:hypothetical protein